MTQPIEVRDAKAGDMEAVTGIYRFYVETSTISFELSPPAVAEIANRRDRLIAAGYPYLVAVSGGRIVGYAYAGPFRERAAYRATVEDSIYVAEDRRGQGIGRALLSRLIKDCRTRGFRQMIAGIAVDEGDPAPGTASIALHRGLGFFHAGRFPAVGWKFDRAVDVVFLQRELE